MIAAYEHKAVWTGKELLVGQKAAYNPATDTWRAIRSLDDMRYRTDYSLVWTGKVALFWGGEDGQYDYKNTGASYDPTVDTWKLTSTAGAPTARYNHVGIWTGDRMIVWGGGTIFAITDKTRNSESFRSGGVFTP
jgi:hypothetical protein